jgi:hypothetical protein
MKVFLREANPEYVSMHGKNNPGSVPGLFGFSSPWDLCSRGNDKSVQFLLFRKSSIMIENIQ